MGDPLRTKGGQSNCSGAAGFRGGRTMVVRKKLAHLRDVAPLTPANIESTRRWQQSTVLVERGEIGMNITKKVRVAVNGYGVIGKRVADAVVLQPDMALAGVCDVSADWRPRMALAKGFALFGATADHAAAMRAVDLAVSGTLDDLLAQADVVVDCTPKRIAAANVEAYRKRGIRFILQGGEKHSVTGHSFVAEASFASAIGRDSTRVVSCNTTSIVRTLNALKRASLLARARGTLLRRATDPWESHLGGIMNTLVPEPTIPSHQGPDAQSVDPDLDVVTMAVKVPETLAHLHYWSVQMTRAATKAEVLDAFRASSRIALIRMDDGLDALNAVKEMMADLGRPIPGTRMWTSCAA